MCCTTVRCCSRNKFAESADTGSGAARAIGSRSAVVDHRGARRRDRHRRLAEQHRRRHVVHRLRRLHDGVHLHILCVGESVSLSQSVLRGRIKK
jgi:hypothetical protein